MVRPKIAAPKCLAEESQAASSCQKDAPSSKGMLQSIISTVINAASACKKRLGVRLRKKKYSDELVANIAMLTTALDPVRAETLRPTPNAARKIRADQRNVFFQLTRISHLSSNA